MAPERGPMGDEEVDALLGQRAAAGDPAAALRLLDCALDDIGAGRYQHRVLALASFSLFVDVAESALTGLLFVEFQREWGVPAAELAVVGSASALGMMLGSFFGGWASDRWGRLATFKTTLATCLCGGLVSSLAPSVPVYAACRLLVGVAVGSNVVVCNALLLESVPRASRGPYVVFTGLAHGVAHLSMVAMAWLLFPVVGWRWVIRMTAALALPLLPLLAYVDESPRYLLLKGRLAEAVRVVQSVARANGQPAPEAFCEGKLRGLGLPSEAAPAKASVCCQPQLLRGRNVRVLVPLLVVWFMQSFASGVFTFLPLELERHLGGHQVHFATALVMAVAGVAGTLFNLVCVRRFPRRHMIRFGTLLSALATLSLLAGRKLPLLLASVFAMHTASCITAGTLFLYTPEVFPTRVRATAFGSCLVAYRVAQIASPFLVAALVKAPLSWTSAVFASLYVLTALSSIALRAESAGAELYEGEPPPCKAADGLPEESNHV